MLRVPDGILNTTQYGWVVTESPEFIKHTRSDASNSRPKLINRTHFVRDNLLNQPMQEDPDTELVEASANADAPPDIEELMEQQAQGSLFS